MASSGVTFGHLWLGLRDGVTARESGPHRLLGQYGGPGGRFFAARPTISERSWRSPGAQLSAPEWRTVHHRAWNEPRTESMMPDQMLYGRRGE